MDDYAGRVLAERYRLPRPPSDAYDLVETRAFDTYSGQEVVVRQIPLPEVIDAEVAGADGRYGPAARPGAGTGAAPGRRHRDPAVQRALDAAAAAADLPDHPRLGQVFDVFAEDGSLWIVSERVMARPLAALLADRTLSPHRAAEIAADVLTALRALHGQGWTHRNITARTVLVCDDGRAVLTGLAAGAAEEALCGYDPLPRPAASGPDEGPDEGQGGPGPHPGGGGPGNGGPGGGPSPGTPVTGPNAQARTPGALDPSRGPALQPGPSGTPSDPPGGGPAPVYHRETAPMGYAGDGRSEGGPGNGTGPGGAVPGGAVARRGDEPGDGSGGRTEDAASAAVERAQDGRGARPSAIAAYRAGTLAAARGRTRPGAVSKVPPQDTQGSGGGAEAPGLTGASPYGTGPATGATADASAGNGTAPHPPELPSPPPGSGFRPAAPRTPLVAENIWSGPQDNTRSGPWPGARPGTSTGGPDGNGAPGAPGGALSAPQGGGPGGGGPGAPSAAWGGGSGGRAPGGGAQGGSGGGGRGYGRGGSGRAGGESGRGSGGYGGGPGNGASGAGDSGAGGKSRWDDVVGSGGASRYRGPVTPLAAERARQARILVVGAVTERWAPEQAGPVHENWRLAPPVGPATDLWAVGALLFRAVQGHAPYPEENAAELVQLVCAETPAFAEECGPLRPVVESLLRQDPTERPEAEELRGWLRSLIRSAPEPDVGSRTVTVPSLDSAGSAPRALDPSVKNPRRLPVLRRRGELVRRRRADSAAVVHGRHKRAPEKRRSGGPRRLGRILLGLVLMLLIAAIAYAMMFLPRAGENQGQGRTGSAGSVGSAPEPAPSPSPGESRDQDQGQGGKDNDKDDGGKATSSAGLPKDFTLREDSAGFQVAVPKGWQRQGENGRGQIRYVKDDFELIVVPGRDTVAEFGRDPMAYQQDEEDELAPFRSSQWSSASGQRRIDVGGTAMAEGTFAWKDSAGRQVHVRNLAMILGDRYHLVLVIGPENDAAEVDRAYEQATTTYRTTG